MIICLKYRCCSVDGDKDVTLGDGKQLQQYIIQAVKSDAAYLIILHTHTHFHTPSIAFRHLPPNSARFSYAAGGALFISAQRSSDAVIVPELCESRGGRPGLSVLTSLLVSVDVKIY